MASFALRRSHFSRVSGTAEKGFTDALVFSMLLVFSFTSLPLFARTWTDSTKTHHIEANLVNILDESIQLRTDDGRDIEVPIKMLSDEDQVHVNVERSKRKQAESQPDTTAEQPMMHLGEGEADGAKATGPKTGEINNTQQSREVTRTSPDPMPTSLGFMEILIFVLCSLILVGAVMGVVALPVWLIASRYRTRRENIKSALDQINAVRGELQRTIEQRFLVQPCSRCHEFWMKFLDISPNARSVEYQCLHCGKKSRAAAVSPDSAEFFDLSNRLSSWLRYYNSVSKSPITESQIEFQTAPAPLPYEQTHRLPISEALRSEVWRRDQGKCVKCASNANLQFDHIIPVARGGATTVKNLQLLCQRCNQSKGSQI